MNPTPYLFFDGNCAEALDFYAGVFGAEVDMKLPASEMPPEYPIPEDRKNWIMHASMKVGEGELMLSDALFGESGAMSGCSVMVSLPTTPEAASTFRQLSEGGNVEMAFEPTFWSAGFGTLTDKFGVRWMVGSDEPPAEG